MSEQDRGLIEEKLAKRREEWNNFHKLIEIQIEMLPEMARQMLVNEFKVFSSKRAFAKLIGRKVTRKSRPRKWTSELVEEACSLYSGAHARLREAKKFYHKQKRSKTWSNDVKKLDHKTNPGMPEMPDSLILQLSHESPAQLAREWTAEQLNSKYPNLNVSAARLKVLMRKAHQHKSKQRDE